MADDLLSADRLVISQRATLIELTNRYAIRGADGAELGQIVQERQTGLHKLARLVSGVDQFLTTHLAVTESTGRRVLSLTRPAKLMKSRVRVETGDGRLVGEIVQVNVFGKIRFDLVGATGEPLGQIRAQNWRAWDFSIVDATEREVARVDKKFVGIAKAVFTTADDYVVDLDPALVGDLRLLVLAAAAAVDVALKQDDRGLDAV